MRDFDWKRLYKTLLFPPLWIILPLALLAGAGLLLVFLGGYDTSPLAYAIYVLSAYTLTLVVLYCVMVLPGRIRATKSRLHEIPVAHRYMSDVSFKVQVSLVGNLLYNALYAAFNLIVGFLNRSGWMVSIGVYYFLLSALRFPLLKHIYTVGERDYEKEYRRYRFTGVGMLLLNLSLSGVMVQMLFFNQGYSYPGLAIFAAAAYTFGSLTMAIVNVARYRKYKSPVLSASRAVQFTVAIVSLMSLETAMLEQFSVGQEDFNGPMLTATAIGVWLTVMGISIYMILRANRALREKKYQQPTE